MSIDSKEKAATACYDKALTLKNAGHYKEAVAALQPLSDKSIHWGAKYQKAVTLLIELSLGDYEDVPLKSMFSIFQWTRSRMRTAQNIEVILNDVISTILNMLVERIEQARATAEEITKSPTEEQLILTALTGVSVAQRAKERLLTPVESHTQRIANELLQHRTIGHSKKVLPIIIHTIGEFIKICTKYQMKHAITRVTKSAVEFFDHFLLRPIPPPIADEAHMFLNSENRTREAERRDFFASHQEKTADDKSLSIVEETVNIFCDLLETTTTLQSWQSTWTAVQFFCRLMDEIKSKTVMRDPQIKANETLAEVFWKCNNYTFHAHCLYISAYLSRTPAKNPGKCANLAVLATLCAPEINEEKRTFARGYDAIFENNAKIGQLFNFAAAPSSTSLWLNLKKFGVLATASADVQKLDEIARAPTMTTATRADALALVEKIVASDPDYERYSVPVRQAILQRYLESTASSETQLDISALVGGTEGSYESYLNQVEPAIIYDYNIPVKIDHRSNTLYFVATTKGKVHTAFTKLASTVDIVPPAMKRAPTISFEALKNLQDRTLLLHKLQIECEKKSTDRLKRMKEDKEEEIRAAKEKRALDEVRRVQATQELKDARLYAQYQERENQERRKLVVQRLKDKYKGFTVDENITSRNANDFVTELTEQLKQYHGRIAKEKTADVQKMNNFERACRELELPRRKDMEEQERRKNKEERTIARQNFLDQHRKEFEKRQQDKQELRRFLEPARKFEEQISRVTDRTTKRDAQQQLLEDEKRRLEGMDE